MYEGMTPEQIIQHMYKHGLTQEGVNRVYQLRGIGQPPTLPANMVGATRQATKGGAWFYGTDGKKVADQRDFIHNFNQTAIDPFRVRSGVSNLAGGILNAVGTYVGGPVWQAFTAAADAGNNALGNNDGTSYTDGRRSNTDRIGSTIGAIGGALKGPGSYGANNPPAGGGNTGIDESGAMGGAGTGGGSGFGGFGGGSSMGWLDTLIDLAPEIYGAYAAHDAAGDAADIQQQGAKEAIAESRRQYDQNRTDLAPYREAGATAVGQLGAGTVTGGDFNRDFTLADFQKDPGYQFRMDEGRNALEGSAAAGGGLFSGATGKRLERYGQDYASGEYSNAYNRFNNDRTTRFNRLASIAGVGQTATNTGVAAGLNSSRDVTDSIIGGANAEAAGRVGQANAVTGGLESLGDYYRNRRYGGQPAGGI